jgi:hypothetical protein
LVVLMRISPCSHPRASVWIWEISAEGARAVCGAGIAHATAQQNAQSNAPAVARAIFIVSRCSESASKNELD